MKNYFSRYVNPSKSCEIDPIKLKEGDNVENNKVSFCYLYNCGNIGLNGVSLSHCVVVMLFGGKQCFCLHDAHTSSIPSRLVFQNAVSLISLCIVLFFCGFL